MSLSAGVSKIPAKGVFARAFLNLAEKEVAKIDQAVESAIIELTTRIIDDTPYGKPELWGNYWRKMRGVDRGQYEAGHLKLNWQFKTSPPSTELQGQDKTGNTPKAVVRMTVRGAEEATYYFYNTAPYAYDIEMGYSYQAPQGMMRQNLALWPSIVKKYGM